MSYKKLTQALKHLPGEHDQHSHAGDSSSTSFTSEQRGQIEKMVKRVQAGKLTRAQLSKQLTGDREQLSTWEQSGNQQLSDMFRHRIAAVEEVLKRTEKKDAITALPKPHPHIEEMSADDLAFERDVLTTRLRDFEKNPPSKKILLQTQSNLHRVEERMGKGKH